MKPVPEPLPRPSDHEERMRVARRVAEYELGSSGWAGVIIAAYLDPGSAIDEAIAEGLVR